MKLSDIRKKSVADIQKLIQDKREALAAFRYSVAGGRATNTKEGRNTRRHLAQLLTILKEKEKEANV